MTRIMDSKQAEKVYVKIASPIPHKMAYVARVEMDDVTRMRTTAS